jgi:hypothetical protein
MVSLNTQKVNSVIKLIEKQAFQTVFLVLVSVVLRVLFCSFCCGSCIKDEADVTSRAHAGKQNVGLYQFETGNRKRCELTSETRVRN